MSLKKNYYKPITNLLYILRECLRFLFENSEPLYNNSTCSYEREFNIHVDISETKTGLEIIFGDNGLGIENPYELAKMIKKGVMISSILLYIFEKLIILSKIDIGDEYFKLKINKKSINDEDSIYISWYRTGLYDNGDFTLESFNKITLSGFGDNYDYSGFEGIKKSIQISFSEYLKRGNLKFSITHNGIKHMPELYSVPGTTELMEIPWLSKESIEALQPV